MTSPANVVYGQRKRQLKVAALGAAIWLLPCFVLVTVAIHGFSNIPWYHFKPTFMVIRNLQSPNNNIAWQAMNELDRREAAGDLSAKYESQLAEFGLAQQAATSNGTLASWAIEFTEKQYLAGKLTEMQKKRLFQQSAQLQLVAPSAVQIGKEVPFQMNEASRITNPYFSVTIIDWNSIIIDGQVVVQGPGGSGSFSGLGAAGSAGSSVPYSKPGVHCLTIVPQIRLHQRTGSADSVVYTEDRPLTAQFTVVGRAK